MNSGPRMGERSGISFRCRAERGGVGWIGGYNLDSGQQIWYHDAPDTVSIHVNVSKDGSLFAGDGGNRRSLDFSLPADVGAESRGRHHTIRAGLIQPGYLEAERLVNMSHHNYSLEPNVTFTPDMKWIIFRSNMFGPSYAFAVEVAKAE